MVTLRDHAVRLPHIPEFLRKEGKITWEEGCLSVPDYTADVERAAEVTIRAIDLDGSLAKALTDLEAAGVQLVG